MLHSPWSKLYYFLFAARLSTADSSVIFQSAFDLPVGLNGIAMNHALRGSEAGVLGDQSTQIDYNYPLLRTPRALHEWLLSQRIPACLLDQEHLLAIDNIEAPQVSAVTRLADAVYATERTTVAILAVTRKILYPKDFIRHCSKPCCQHKHWLMSTRRKREPVLTCRYFKILKAHLWSSSHVSWLRTIPCGTGMNSKPRRTSKSAPSLEAAAPDSGVGVTWHFDAILDIDPLRCTAIESREKRRLGRQRPRFVPEPRIWECATNTFKRELHLVRYSCPAFKLLNSMR